MKRFFPTLFAVLVVSLSAANAFAQETMNGPPPYGDFKATKFPEDNYGSDRNFSRFPRVPREDRVLKKGPLAPPAKDREALKGFLRNSDTGLIRLMPREVAGSGSDREKQKLNLPGGGAYYSFNDLTHAYGYGPDIVLEPDALSAVFDGFSYGLLTNIGDTPLEQIRIDDLRVRALAAYLPPTAGMELREQLRLLSSGDGIMLAGMLYQRSVPVREHSTYLLRSIRYFTSSVLVAFRVVRQEADGSVIIAWKLLKGYLPPKLKRTS